MRMPNAENAEISPAKLRFYLLSREHPVGRYKAAFFAQLGFVEASWREFESRLLELATGEAEPAGSSPHGEKYAIRGTLKGPGGQATVQTIWIIPAAAENPQLVTVYPAE